MCIETIIGGKREIETHGITSMYIETILDNQPYKHARWNHLYMYRDYRGYTHFNKAAEESPLCI